MINSALLYRLSVQHAHQLGPWQAILGAVTRHHTKWVSSVKEAKAGAAAPKALPGVPLPSSGAIAPLPVFRVLDLASGPRGEPGTTIAHALPLALVHCTDSCELAVAEIPVVTATITTVVDDKAAAALPVLTLVAALPTSDEPDLVPIVVQEPVPGPTTVAPLSIILPPKNLTKSVQDLTNLSSYESNTINAIVCCYGYGLSENLPAALQEAHRVLVPGGILVIATWQESAMLSIGRDVLGFVRSGGLSALSSSSEEEWFLPPIVKPLEDIELSGEGELEALLQTAGFVDDFQPLQEGEDPRELAVITTRGMGYPYDLGNTPLDQFDMGTVLIREELEHLGALQQEGSVDAGGWNSLAEEGFWKNIRKYIDTTETTSADSGSRNTMLLKDNIFKLTVATKSYIVPAS